MKTGFLQNLFLNKSKIENGEKIGLELISDGFVSPLELTFAKGIDSLFVIDRIGLIKKIDDGKMQEKPFLDIRKKIVGLNPVYDERGLLGLAFHPNFRNNGKFYVYYNAKLRKEAPKGWNSTLKLSEFKISEDGNADENSERVIFEIDKPYMNHNGGTIVFGDDKFLYITIGDGGNANDAGKGHNPKIGNGQDTFSILGKILRIDVDKKQSGKEYGIPTDNPFSDGKKGLKEIYAYGFRNPWRISFNNGKLIAGDVGQAVWEEVDVVEKGKNYGWNIKEGTHCFSKTNPTKEPEICRNVGYDNEFLTDPVLEYSHFQKNLSAHAIIGGFIYYGKEISKLKGKYIFGDWSSSFVRADGTLFIATPSEKGKWEFKELKVEGRKNGRLGEYLLSFGKDQKGELYISTAKKLTSLGSSGKVYKIIKT